MGIRTIPSFGGAVLQAPCPVMDGHRTGPACPRPSDPRNQVEGVARVPCRHEDVSRDGKTSCRSLPFSNDLSMILQRCRSRLYPRHHTPTAVVQWVMLPDQEAKK